MTDALRIAARNTEKFSPSLIFANHPRANAAGILNDPSSMLADLHAARKLIDDSIAVCSATNWPGESDCHAL
jgi:hypothetical protein